MKPEESYLYFYRQWCDKVDQILFGLGYDATSIKDHGNRKIYVPQLTGREVVPIEEFELDGKLLARFSGNGICYLMEFFS